MGHSQLHDEIKGFVDKGKNSCDLSVLLLNI